VVADAALSLARHEIVGFLDDNPSLSGRSVMGLPVLGPISTWRDHNIDGLIPAIGANRARRDIMQRETSGNAKAVTIVHPRATVSTWAELKSGIVVFAGAIINAYAKIGQNVIINTGAIVEHDCEIGDHAHVAPGVLSGRRGENRRGKSSRARQPRPARSAHRKLVRHRGRRSRD